MGFRYIGAKTRVIKEVLRAISQIVPTGSHVADIMCGTAGVSVALRKAGYRVTANDVMTYSFHHARVALLFTASPEFAGARDFSAHFCPEAGRGLFALSPHEHVLAALARVPPRHGYFWREFSPAGSPSNASKPRSYFTPENAAKIDGIRMWIRELRMTGLSNGLEHSLLLHDLIMAANDVANIAGTYGHYLSRLRGRAKSAIELRPTGLLLRDDGGEHIVMQGYAEKVASRISCDLCYIDPPYMKRQYAANYHIPETLAREDHPEATGQSGLRPWRDQYSDFCTKTRGREAFRKVVSRMDCGHFLVSYSEDGLLAIQELEELLGEFGEVQTRTFRNKRFKSHDRQQPPNITEYLVHLAIA